MEYKSQVKISFKRIFKLHFVAFFDEIFGADKLHDGMVNFDDVFPLKFYQPIF